MKINFSRSVPFIPEWNGNRNLLPGDQIKCSIQPMILGDLVVLLDVLGTVVKEKNEGDGEIAKQQMSASEAALMIDACKDLLPKYVTMTGLEDDDGPVGIEQITLYAQYMPLASEIIMACASISSPTPATEGNLPALQG